MCRLFNNTVAIKLVCETNCDIESITLLSGDQLWLHSAKDVLKALAHV